MTATAARSDRLQVTAPNGVTWTRHADGTSTPRQFLQALVDLRALHTVPGAWNWWREGQAQQEADRVHEIITDWENGAPQKTPAQAEAFAKDYMARFDADFKREQRNRAQRARRSYNAERERIRLEMLRLESDAAFFGHVARSAVSSEQQAAAEQRAAAAREVAANKRSELGMDPERVIDALGYTPAERREFHQRSHMDHWRHQRLRDWASTDKRRFSALLAMPCPRVEDMCSECEAPTSWHDFDISLRLFHPRPEPGSKAEAFERFMPGWWDRCPACTAYNICHRWGGSQAVHSFTGEQYIAMLPPLLKAIFGPAPEPRKRPARPKPKPLAVIPAGLPLNEVTRRLQEAETRFPGAEVRRGTNDGWEVWPAPRDS